jgi:hypothetical protein
MNEGTARRGYARRIIAPGDPVRMFGIGVAIDAVRAKTVSDLATFEPWHADGERFEFLRWIAPASEMDAPEQFALLQRGSGSSKLTIAAHRLQLQHEDRRSERRNPGAHGRKTRALEALTVAMGQTDENTPEKRNIREAAALILNTLRREKINTTGFRVRGDRPEESGERRGTTLGAIRLEGPAAGV